MAKNHPANIPSFSTMAVIGRRDASLAAHDQHCETKTIWMDLSS